MKKFERNLRNLLSERAEKEFRWAIKNIIGSWFMEPAVSDLIYGKENLIGPHEMFLNEKEMKASWRKFKKRWQAPGDYYLEEVLIHLLAGAILCGDIKCDAMLDIFGEKKEGKIDPEEVPFDPLDLNELWTQGGRVSFSGTGDHKDGPEGKSFKQCRVFFERAEKKKK